ncbi:hypothetical protein H6P81_013269 [Aristolochia fimbriata]|uniref:Uncharacterized protein n=1 Tax=Aristolochia fimbriata TaxID=158543 RepID=A0AAV7EFG1_ARIFI|nr:hypothetical protein H6P81_013269 [Aristolochia fimbriata]
MGITAAYRAQKGVTVSEVPSPNDLVRMQFLTLSSPYNEETFTIRGETLLCSLASLLEYSLGIHGCFVFQFHLEQQKRRDIKHPKMGLDEIGDGGNSSQVFNIKLVKHDTGKSRKIESFYNLLPPFLISCCQYHQDPITSQLPTDFQSDSLVHSCNDGSPGRNINL